MCYEVIYYLASNVQYVNVNGNVNYNDCDWDQGVRPFWDGRCNKVRKTLKLEPRHQKNRYPFQLKLLDKYKGINQAYHIRWWVNHLSNFDCLIDFHNLYQAYKKARRGKGHNKSRLKFEMAAMDGIFQLQRLLETKQFDVSPYNTFKVYEPKERIIEAGSFKDKIVQHCICDNILLPFLEHEFIQTNVAGQIGKGTLYGLECLNAHMRLAFLKYGYDCWIVKGDIRKYFYSIDHSVLKDILSYFLEDKNVLWVCEKFIDSTNSPGLPLGNQITQVFALLFLSGLDHFITGELGVKYYGRYMDDFYLIVPNKEYAKNCLDNITEFISTLHLELNEKTQIIPFRNGIKYCGFHTYVSKQGKIIRKLTNEKKRQARKKYIRMAKLVNDGKLSREKFNESYLSWKNYISYGNCIKLGYHMDQSIMEILNHEGE